MTMVSKDAREWAERIVSRHDVNNWPEQYRQKARWDHEVRKAGLVTDDLLTTLKELYETVGNVWFDGDQLAAIDAAMIKARDTIAKAEGRS